MRAEAEFKKGFSSELILVTPNPPPPVVEVDALELGVGAIQSQCSPQDRKQRIYGQSEEEVHPKPIVLVTHIVAPVMWDIESLVQGAQRLEPDPGGTPPNCLFVPTRSQVLQ